MNIKDLDRSNLGEYAKQQIREAFGKDRNRTSDTPSNLESNTRNESVPKIKTAKFNSPVRIDIYSSRIGKADIDNISGKAVLDGIVKSGLLRDDSPDEIAAYQVHKAVISKEEKTLIIITSL